MGESCYADSLGNGICVHFFLDADVVCGVTVQRCERVVKRRNDDYEF